MGQNSSSVGTALKLLNVLVLTTEALSQPFSQSSELVEDEGWKERMWKRAFQGALEVLTSEVSPFILSTSVQAITKSLKGNDSNITNQNLENLYERLLPLLPPSLQEYAQNPNSALMRFVKLNSGLLDADLLGQCLDECMPYF